MKKFENSFKIKSAEWNTQTDRQTHRPTQNFINIDIHKYIINQTQKQIIFLHMYLIKYHLLASKHNLNS